MDGVAAGVQGLGLVEGGGVWVIGEGSVMVEPDLALLGLGVEARAETVGAAREQAAAAMAAVVAALKRLGVADLDVQTRSFDIDPIYDYFEEFDEVTGRHTGREVLTGYRVSNLSSVKVRDLELVGEMIDAAAEAGGDAVRINGVRFTVEDMELFTAALREDAFTDALAKAEHFASLAGVSIGKLVRIHEAGGPLPAGQDLAETGYDQPTAADTGFSPSPIGGGELELRMSVQAVFEIN